MKIKKDPNEKNVKKALSKLQNIETKNINEKNKYKFIFFKLSEKKIFEKIKIVNTDGKNLKTEEDGINILPFNSAKPKLAKMTETEKKVVIEIGKFKFCINDL